MTLLSAALLVLALFGAFRLPRPDSRAASFAWALAVAAAGLGFTRALRPHVHPESQLWLL